MNFEGQLPVLAGPQFTQMQSRRLDKQVLSGLSEIWVYDVGPRRVSVGHSHTQGRRSFCFFPWNLKAVPRHARGSRCLPHPFPGNHFPSPMVLFCHKARLNWNSAAVGLRKYLCIYIGCDLTRMLATCTKFRFRCQET